MTEAPVSTTVEHGVDATLGCGSNGVPNTVVWYKDGQVFTPTGTTSVS